MKLGDPMGPSWKNRKPRSRRFLGAVTGALLALGSTAVVLPAVGASPAPSLSTTLNGFEAGDGNMTADAPGTLDWNCFNAATQTSNCATPTGHFQNVAADPGGVETTWKSGQKFDTLAPQFITGGTPPKDDYTDVASYAEAASSSPFDVFFDGAAIRSTSTGNASGDVEFNQEAFPPPNGQTFQRTAGDKLLTYDFLNGGATVPVIRVLTWIDSKNPTAGGNSGKCNVPHDSLPCWGSNVTVPTTVIGASNSSPITSNGLNGVNLPVNEFSEFGVDLTSVFGLTNTCTTFPQEIWESRSSGSSFTSNPEDIEVVSDTVQTCATVTVIKRTSPSGQNHAFGFTSDLPANSAAGGVVCTGNQTSGIQADGSFCVNANGSTSASDSATSTVSTGDVSPGMYTVTEDAPTSGYAFDNVACTASTGSSGGADPNTARTADITLLPSGSVTCVFTNDALGEIKIVKQTDPRGLNQAFGFSSSGGPGTGGLAQGSGTGGVVCSGKSSAGVQSDGSFCLNDASSSASTDTVDVTNVPTGTYTVTETEPASWGLQGLSCSASGTGSSGQQNGTTPTLANITLAAGGVVTCTYTNVPLTDINIESKSEVTGGTQSTILCTDSANPANTVASVGTASGDAKTSALGLVPGTYTCTVVISPHS